MRILVDQDIYQAAIDFLKNEGHDIITIKELSLNKAADVELLKKSGSKVCYTG